MGSNGLLPGDYPKLIDEYTSLKSDSNSDPFEDYYDKKIPHISCQHYQGVCYQGEYSADPVIGSDPVPVTRSNPEPVTGSNPVSGSNKLMVAGVVEGGSNGKGATGSRSRVKLPKPSKGGRKGPKGRPSWFPTCWKVVSKPRQNGVSAGVVDKYYVDPATDKKLRSKNEVMRWLKDFGKAEAPNKESRQPL